MNLRLPRFALERRQRASLPAHESGRDGRRAARADPVGDARALANLATCLLRFTPDVVIDGALEVEGKGAIDGLAGGASLLLEIGRTGHLFPGGEPALARAVRELCGSLGFRAALGVDATPEAARVRARGGGSDAPDAPDDVPLGELPWQALAPEPAIADACVLLGLRTVGELLALPRAGLATRTSVAFVQQLRRMLGELDEPLERIRPPDRFEEEIELPAPSGDLSVLLFAAKRLLDAAEAALAARHRALVTATLVLAPIAGGRETKRSIALSPSEPTRSASLLLRLLAHRLERERAASAWREPIDKLVLSFEQTVELRPAQEALYEDLGNTADERDRGFPARDRAWEHDAAVLRDRLAVRLGRERVNVADLVDDHRPERAFRWRRHGEPGGEPATAPNPGAAPGPRPLELERVPQPVRVDADAEGRPLRLHGESGADARGGALALRVVRGPERIECGWWDGHDVERAYFEVETEDGARLWLFRDRAGVFFRHGVFS